LPPKVDVWMKGLVSRTLQIFGVEMKAGAA
jgi:hypothetical protein